MAIELPVCGFRRVVPVRFASMATRTPVASRPWIDDRGFGADRSAVAGVMKGKAASVYLLRERIGLDAPLTITSSKPEVVSVAEPDGGFPLLGEQRHIVTFTAESSASSTERKAELHVRYGDGSGPILHSLTIAVHPAIRLYCALYKVRLRIRNTAQSALPAANIDTTLKYTKAILSPVGITLAREPLTPEQSTFTFDTARGPLTTDDAAELFKRGVPRADVINIFFVRMAESVGLGVGTHMMGALGFERPGIFVADTMDGVEFVSASPLQTAQVLAHEIGHYLKLWHPEKVNADPVDAMPMDSWSRRSLMYPTSSMPPGDPALDSELGTGHILVPAERSLNGKAAMLPYCGYFLSQKNLPQLKVDGECAAMRSSAWSQYVKPARDAARAARAAGG